MPTLNAERFIEASLVSIFDQGVDGLEVVISDGGSTDRTLDIASGFASRGTVRILEGKDSGISHGLNRAFEAASGDYFGWMNANDAYAPGGLAAIVSLLRVSSWASIAYGCRERINERGDVIGWDPALPAWDWVQRFEGYVMTSQSMLWTRELHERVGAFDERFKYGMDGDFILRLLEATRPTEAVRIPTTVGYWRIHSGQLTGSASSKVLNYERQIRTEKSGRGTQSRRSAVLLGLQHSLLWFAGRIVRAITVLRRRGVGGFADLNLARAPMIAPPRERLSARAKM
jgi:glycosyltransferase involved in cell wall biosynthesis